VETLGEVYYRLKQYEKAVEALEKVAGDSQYWDHQIKAHCHFYLRQWDKEYQATRRAFELIPEGPMKYLSVLSYAIRMEYNQALLFIDEFIAKQPDVFDAWNLRATILKEMVGTALRDCRIKRDLFPGTTRGSIGIDRQGSRTRFPSLNNLPENRYLSHIL
jgi:tetratricopeptide (TPR) repeat protein